MKTAVPTSLLALAFAALASPVAGQSAREIVERAKAKYDESTAGVDNYTVHQKAFGIETSMRFERREVDGESVLVPVETTSSMGSVPLDQAKEQSAYTDPWSDYEEWVDGATVDGSEEVEGEDSWILLLNDLPENLSVPTGGEGEGGFEPRSARLFVDKDEHVVRRVVVDGVMRSDGQERESTAVITLSDYRTVQSLVYPFVMRVQFEGMMDDAQAAETREALAEMEKQLEAMDEAQRRMVEQMMKAQMEQIRNMLGGGGMEIVIETTRLDVNTDPS